MASIRFQRLCILTPASHVELGLCLRSSYAVQSSSRLVEEIKESGLNLSTGDEGLTKCLNVGSTSRHCQIQVFGVSAVITETETESLQTSDEMLPMAMKAAVTDGNGGFDLKEISVPVAGPDDILIKVAAVAQNPTDWKTLLLHKRQGNVLGCDFAGTVVSIGSKVPLGLRQVGERVAGMVHGGVQPNGAFAEYLVTPAALVISLPDAMTFEEGAQLGAACYTTCQALYQTFDLPTPLKPAAIHDSILIWSGTSSVGQYAIQFAKLAGLRVISTSSRKNIEFVKSLGADEVFDYADSWTPKDIFSATEGSLKCAIDCISSGRTPNQVSSSLSKDGGAIATLLPYQSRTRGVTTVFVLVYSMFGKDIEFPFLFPASPEHYENAVRYSALISEILSNHQLKHVPIKLYPHGLASLADGLEYMRAGKVHAEKITYRISDTPGL